MNIIKRTFIRKFGTWDGFWASGWPPIAIFAVWIAFLASLVAHPW